MTDIKPTTPKKTTRKKAWGVPFKKGVSGNPAGRPKGIRDKRFMFRKMLEEGGDDFVKLAIQMARDGDSQMTMFILRQLLPALPTDEGINLDGFEGSLTTKSKRILDAMTSSEITPAEGNRLYGGMLSHCKIVETEEILRRIEKLEGKQNE